MCKYWAVRWAFRCSSGLVALLLFTSPSYSDTTWTGTGPGQNWSTGTNWSGGVPPISTDVVTFGAAGSGSSNIVDTNYTISGLQYIDNSVHDMSLNAAIKLLISGPASVGTTSPGIGATATWTSDTVTVGRLGGTQASGIEISNAGTGTLSILGSNSTLAIDATNVYFGRGGGTGILDVPAGGTFLLGTAGNPISALGIGYNDLNSGGTGTAHLDFTVTNPTFTAYVGDALSIGSKISNSSTLAGGNADGSLTLGSNSTLIVGTPAARAGLAIGTNNAAGTATGLLDARQGTIDLHLTTLNVGYASAGGAATGTMTMGNGSSVDATTVNIGSGSNASGTFNLTGGLLIAQTINVGAADAFNFTGGRLAVGTFNNTLNPEGLNQQGGTLAPGNSPGLTTINGNYNLWSPGTLEIQLLGITPGSLFDQVKVNGLVNLNFDQGAGGMLDTILGFGPNIGDSFLILDNDGTDAISGFFSGLPEGATFTENYLGNVFTFGITYLGGTGNDIVLNTVDVGPQGVPEPGSLLLLIVGFAVAGLARMQPLARRTMRRSKA